MEVYLDGAWRDFDPRNNALRIASIVIAEGRDAADAPLGEVRDGHNGPEWCLVDEIDMR